MDPLNKQQISQLLGELVRIPSINPKLTQDREANEMQLALFIHKWLTDRQIKAHIDEVLPGRPNVYAEIGEGDGKTLCFCSHIDTVDVAEMTIPPFEPTVEDHRLYGRGSCDMKGGLAAILSAVAALAQQKLKGRVILALVCDEEYASIGADDFVKKYHADACVLTEPSNLQVVISHRGFLFGKVTTKGKSAHGSRWDIGESAITKMGPILVGLDQFEKTILRNRVAPLVGPASMHVSLIQGGTGISTYASECSIHIERRTLPSENLAEIKHELEQLILQYCPDAQIEWILDRSPFSCDAHEAIVQSVQQGYQQVMTQKAQLAGCWFWTDAAIFQQAGIPTVNIGPTGFGMHEPVEWVDVDSVAHNAAILYRTALHFLEMIVPPLTILKHKESL